MYSKNCPIIPPYTFFEVLGRMKRNPRTHARERRVYATIWSYHPLWKFWYWKLTIHTIKCGFSESIK